MKLKVFETFSGIGAQNSALKNLKEKVKGFSFEVIGTSDWDVYATQSYAAIHHNGFEKKKDYKQEEVEDWLLNNVISLDGKKEIANKNRLIKDQKKLQYIYKAYKESNNIGTIVNSFDRVSKEIIEKHGEIDLLTYSFPCQDLSAAGSFHGFNEGIKKHTRSGLLFEIEKLLNEMNRHEFKNGKVNKSKTNNILPKYLLLENVINLVQKKHLPDFNDWLQKLDKLGYKTIWGVVNAYEFGMIQARRRVFALSVYDPKGKLNWETNIRSDLSETLKDIFDSGEYKPKQIQKHADVFDFNNKYKEESILSLMKKTPSRERMEEWGLNIDKNYKGKISTITTKQDRWPNVGNIEFINNKKDKKGTKYLNKRFITPREAYKLMGFTNEQYELAKEIMLAATVSEISTREKMYKQAGNSIAVNALEMIFYYLTKIEKEMK